MGLRNGSDEHWKILEQAERYYRKRCDSTGSAREHWTEKCNKLADQLREDYGYSDPIVKDIIERYYLDRD